MYFYLNILAGIGIFIVLVLVLRSTINRHSNRRGIKIHDASLTCEELEQHARETAVEHVVSKKPNLFNSLMPRMNENYSYIISVYKDLNEDVQKKLSIPSAAEWLLDNFYIIEEQVKYTRRDLTMREYSRLPVLKSGSMKGYARIYAIAMELVSHTNGQIDERILLNYIRAYQTHTNLSDREIWAMANMIRLALIENIRYVCEKIKDTQLNWRKADEFVDDLLSAEESGMDKVIKSSHEKIRELDEINPSFIEHLAYRLRRAGRAYAHILGFIDEVLSKHGTTIDNLTQKEHSSQAVNTVSIGNCIMSIKFISSLDWTDVFQSSSQVEQILSEDPDGTYPLMDLDSRNIYRLKIEDLAEAYKVSEAHISREAIELARESLNSKNADAADTGISSPSHHVGYYLIGNGTKKLEEKLGYEATPFGRLSSYIKEHPTSIYLGSVTVVTFVLVCLIVQYTYNAAAKYSLLLSILSFFIVLIPSIDIAVCLVNWAVCSIIKPVTLPKLELKEGIPGDLSTMVVIPVLIPDEKRVYELLENLETHYLANKEENLYFALAGDFKDAPQQSLPEDRKIINAALNGIRKLNKKYSNNGQDIFYFFHRHRQFNEKQNKWMGWERKRGALIELNDLLLGSSETSYSICSNSILPASGIKYVITLDADTILPIDGAKKMVGTMAHPLNRPIIDHKKGIVYEGYGLVQPKIVFDVESSNRSLFSRIFTGQEGIDPYASAISDVYQDLFKEGIFTGKGIYDLKVFQNILKNAIPDNVVLSHDLLEGSYVRAALATDLELVDSYPSRYNSYSARLHRWVRGDWQLIPWLSGIVTNRDGERINNPLTGISRWKIIDNLRRSLVAPSVMLLIALGFSIFPGDSLLWLGYAVIALAFCLITSFIDYLISRKFMTHKIKRHVPVISGLKATFIQVLLMFVFLPYQAYLMMDAIVRTLTRIFFTKKNMLEWVTAADVEKGQKNSLESFWTKMRISVLLALALVALCIAFKPGSIILCLLVFIIWSLSPFIAYWISITKEDAPVMLTDEERLELRRIARKTWRYFEEFMNSKNHYLPPDNYQEDPPNGIAYRTSPTNIGLGLLAVLTARDLGYIGIYEMTDIISNTVSTIEKMEKWNGHLYNWYDTRLLRPLRPRYISTVDSGNLVCYLVTLIQGMTEILNRPPVDTAFIQGIKDTAGMIDTDSTLQYPGIKLLDELKGENTVDPLLWDNILTQLQTDFSDVSNKKYPWRLKSERAVNMFKRELSEFMPWIELLKTIPESVSNNSPDLPEQLIAGLKTAAGLKDLPALYNNISASINGLLEAVNNSNNSNPVLSEWLLELKESLEQAAGRIQSFIERYIHLIVRIRALSDNTVFAPLYVEKKQLFSIGYNIEENRLTNSYYDLLASEARQTSFIAIARGEVPPKHWFKMGRTLTIIDSYKGLVSWTGTMFEYLMPLLIMKSYKNTLLDETYSFVVRSQKKYGSQRHIPWGYSESGFYSLDINLDYQYKAIGVPWLGLKRGLIEDAVVAPYAAILALPLDPQGVMKNIKRLKSEGLDGPYGYYEAVDYTLDRLPFGSKSAVVKSFMSHHQGMSLLALNNYLNGNIMQHRFHSDPVIKSANLLLQEKVPTNIVYTKENKEKVLPFKEVVFKEKRAHRKFTRPDAILPKAHILSNGNYSVMVTDKGTGYSKNKSVSVTRWKEDSTLDYYGMSFYIRRNDSGKAWSACYSPFNVLPEKYEVTFTSDKARFKRMDENIETITEIVVTSVDNAEIRKISLKNRGETPCVLEITSYFEVVLVPQAADIAHPAFSNLFIRTEFLSEYNCLAANRRPRSEAESEKWILNTSVVEGELVGGVEYETDRMQFIGRGRTISNPIVMDSSKPLSNSTGPVLDPVMSLRLRLKIDPGQTSSVSFIVAVAESRDAILELAEKYKSPESVEEAFRLALTRSQVETRYLNITTSEMELYQDMISHILFISPLRRNVQDYISKNVKGQSSLWSYGISGDLPILLVVLKKSDEIDIVYEALKAHEYWKIKELKVDMVVLNEEENSYTHPLRGLLKDVVSSSHAHDIVNKPGGVFILNRSNIVEEDIFLLYAVSRIVLRGNGGSLSQQVQSIPKDNISETVKFASVARSYPEQPLRQLNLLYFNELGGFSQDGTEYVIKLEKGRYTPVPWINVIANPGFGFIVSESGSGYTWCENSRENKLTPWSNDPVSDSPGEIIYVSDSETGESWNIAPLPIREDEPYIVIHGFGYSCFEHISHGIEQYMIQFVPIDAPAKISLITLKNISEEKRILKLTYYLRPVLGVSDQFTSMHIQTSLNEQGVLLLRNPYNEEFSGRTAFMDVSEKERSVTGSRKEFIGSGRLSDPEGLKRQKLSGTVGLGYDPCAAMQINIRLEPGEQKEIVLVFGMVNEPGEITGLTSRFNNPRQAKEALEQVKKRWKSRLGAVSINTPDPSMNIMLNGWLMYQTISCRIWARSAFYQSGGAYGFRDQLQDSLCVMHAWPELARNQILLHARHQFKEGDVQHWWHEPKSKGTRTRFSDDLLWLPYVTSEYIRITGDSGILQNSLTYLEDEPLKEFEDERYSIPKVSDEEGTLYDHCIRSIEHASKFGEHGIPLMGSGDWNDGMNTVGNKGKGESVWLGWFLYTTLMKFAPICRSMGDEEKADKYVKTAGNLADAIEENAWDGGWYRRAYFDNGIPMGSVQNSECKIDSISQSWAIISGAGDPQRVIEAMNSVENYLVQRNDGLIKLLAPPFDEGDLEPGYIKSYLPGVRENGGQYTHAAAWVIIAFAVLGEGDKAWELFSLINPINHTRTNMEYTTYKVEPYVMAADVYAVYPHIGRGGWTWYTGSSSWIYRAGLEFILGFRKNGQSLTIDPCIPKRWEEYTIRYKYEETTYIITVKNTDGVSRGVKSTVQDGIELEGNSIPLVNDGKTHRVDVFLG